MPCWQEEYIVVGGGDLEWTHPFRITVECGYRIDHDLPNQVEIDVLIDHVRALGTQWTERNLFRLEGFRTNWHTYLFLYIYNFCSDISFLLTICFCSDRSTERGFVASSGLERA